ncbi:hypothetical protein ACFE04_001413 [Oxalis oulophora]
MNIRVSNPFGFCSSSLSSSSSSSSSCHNHSVFKLLCSRRNSPTNNNNDDKDEKFSTDWDKAWSNFKKQGKKSIFSGFSPNKYVSWNPQRSDYPLSEEVDPIKRTERSNLMLWTSPFFTISLAIVISNTNERLLEFGSRIMLCNLFSYASEIGDILSYIVPLILSFLFPNCVSGPSHRGQKTLLEITDHFPQKDCVVEYALTPLFAPIIFLHRQIWKPPYPLSPYKTQMAATAIYNGEAKDHDIEKIRPPLKRGQLKKRILKKTVKLFSKIVAQLVRKLHRKPKKITCADIKQATWQIK